MTPEQRSMRARVAAHSLHSQRDARETTAAARSAFIDSFKTRVDPEGVLSELERERRAQSALKAHMLKLALASSSARRQRAKAEDVPESPDRMDP